MSAAAAGASCRNARKRQAQQIIKDKAAQAKALKEKLEEAKAAELATPTRSKQFHQLPPTYLRAPQQPHGRKLSAGYTGHSSKLLLPISEQSAQHHSPSQQTLHNRRHQFTHSNDPRIRDLRLGAEQQKNLTRSATASFPLVSHGESPPASPSVGFRQHHFFKENHGNLLTAGNHPIHIQIPNANNDGFIITPATPLPSPSPSNQKQHENQTLHNDQLTRPQERHTTAEVGDDFPEFPLERTCSVYRNRKLEANDTTTVNVADIDDEYQQQFYPGGMPNGNGGHHTHWADEFCDSENRMVGVCTCDHIEVILMSFVKLFCLFCGTQLSFCLNLINHLHVRSHSSFIIP